MHTFYEERLHLKYC